MRRPAAFAGVGLFAGAGAGAGAGAISGGGAGATRVGESKSSLFLALGDRLLILKRLPRRLPRY